MRRIIVVQHCQSEHHINNMSGGWTDTPLTELGVMQAKKIAEKLSKLMNGTEYKLYSSDLLRASQTAEIISSLLNTEVVIESHLREINTGIAAGKTKEWAKANRNPEEIFSLDYREFNEGETRREFLERVYLVLDQIWESTSSDLIIVTHGGTLAYIVEWWLHFKQEMSERAHFSAKAGSISILWENHYKQHTLSLFNDTSHLVY